jgi:DNA adenine methylase
MKTQTNIIPFRPAFPRPGGKTRFLRHILPLIPEHRIYVEPFAGALAVLLAKPRCKVEVVNDMDCDLVTFYRYVRLHKDALLTELGGTTRLNSRADFADLLASKATTDLQRAVRWYLLCVCSYGAQNDTWGRSMTSYHGWSPERHTALINQLAERLERVFVEQGDWEKVVTAFDADDAFIFFDPPYVAAGKTAYDPFSVEEMTRLRKRLGKLKAKWMLTCDDSPQCREIFSGLPAQKIAVKYALANKPKTKTRTFGELLIMHPAISEKAPANIVQFLNPSFARAA